MPTLRTGLIASAVALLAGTAAVVATQAIGNAAPPVPVQVPESGIATLHQTVNLPAGTWTSTPLEVRLPHAGTYAIDANVRGRLQGTPSLNTFITARLWNVTAKAEVPYSDRVVYQLIDLNTESSAIGGNQTAPISELVRVDRPTTIDLQAENVSGIGTTAIAQVASDANGYTTLRYVRVLP
jgi:hypothetical protein